MWQAIAERAEQTAVDACWRQWGALVGDGALSKSAQRSIIDPEALLLTSLALARHEQRLLDRLSWWAIRGAKLLSIQRLLTMSELFPPSVRSEGIPWFAGQATLAGDRQWRHLAKEPHPDLQARGGKGPAELQLLGPATLMLRLRSGFGVGIKADLMAFLVGTCGVHGEPMVWARTKAIAIAISCSVSSVRRAVGEMVLAGFVETLIDRPRSYAVDAGRWAHALRLQEPSRLDPGWSAEERVDVPSWRFWSHLFGFLVATMDWAREIEDSALPPVVAASKARDIADRFERALVWTGVSFPDARVYVGEEYLKGFQWLVESLAAAVSNDVWHNDRP